MLKIYLDHNVYQDLKKPENKSLLDKVLAAKEYVIYCFSEAHLFDLNHDRTDAKFADMHFIETIANNHCYVFTDRTKFIARTPEEYYHDFEWPSSFAFEDTESPFWKMLMGLFKTMPLELHTIVKEEDLPADMPESMRKLLLEPATMYDWCTAMLDFSDDLASNQSQFKELVRYLHKNSLIPKLYETMGIKGFDGSQLTDVDAFWESYAERFIVKGQEKSRYSLFMDMYYGLEVYGLVKGKPKKQKMMSLINDSRHAFFGTVCDVIVSKDNDFLEKCEFIYSIERFGTTVLSYAAFESFLDDLEQSSKLTISSIFEEIGTPITEDKIIDVVQKEENESIVYTGLHHFYYGYFNMLGHAEDKQGVYWSISRKLINYDNRPFKLQIQYIISRLLNELGADIHQKGVFSFEEPIVDKSVIRCWAVQNIVISLILDEIIYLNVYPLQYLEKRWKKDDVAIPV